MTSRIGRDARYFREVVQKFQNSCGQIDTDLQELASAAKDVETVFDELLQQARDFSPRSQRQGLYTIDPNDSSVADPRELIDELRGYLKFAMRSLESAAKTLPDRRAIVAKLIGMD
jgi:predicted sugar kinase